MKAALTMDVLATDLADYLVRKGVRVYPPQSTLLSNIEVYRYLSARRTTFPDGPLR